MKKRIISSLLCLTVLSLSACGTVATGTETVNKILPETVEEHLADETDPDVMEAIGESIENAGKSYDGIVSYDRPSVDSILLRDDIMSVSGKDFDADTRDRKAAVEEYMDLVKKFRGFFKQISVYVPREGYTIAISDKKLFEYKIADTDEILAVYNEIALIREDLPVERDDRFTSSGISGSGGILGGISNFISEKKAAPMYEAATSDACVAEAECTEDMAATAGAEFEDAAVPDSFYGEDAWNTEEYKSFDENRFMSAQASPFSTFGMDVDTASFSNFRKKVFNGRDIPKDSIRTEEMMNYFDYDYTEPKDGMKFGVMAEISDTPWNPDTRLLRIGVKSEEADVSNVSSNVVFLIDTSGSMFDPDKLPLVQKSFLMLLHNLDGNDKVSIVTYAGDDEVICEGIPCNKKEKITEKILSLEAWGGTNGAAGITTAYELARKYYKDNGNNRVILATDGDLNLGVTSESDLVELIKDEKESGVFLSVLGVGEGNYKDSKMKALADNGNGNFAYIDSTASADKALMKDFNSLMYTVAKDAKMQVEFNPAGIKGYRQIGYELRQLNAEDFADDTKDGAEIGSGQCVTVLYEIVPTDSDMEVPGVTSRYGNGGAGDSTTDELLTVSIRYKEPDGEKSQLIEVPVTNAEYNEKMSLDMSWAAGVAEVSQILRDSEYKGTSDYEAVYDRLSKDSRIMQDEDRAQFLYMIRLLEKGNYAVCEEDDGYYW